MTICVDASLVMKWLLPEEESAEALQLLKRWRDQEEVLVAPSLLDYEVGSVLRQKVIRKQVQSEDLFPVFNFYKEAGLGLFHLTNLVDQAVAAAASLDEPTIYDVAYLLTAKQQKADYVSADLRFCQKVQPVYSFVKYYRDLL